MNKSGHLNVERGENANAEKKEKAKNDDQAQEKAPLGNRFFGTAFVFLLSFIVFVPYFFRETIYGGDSFYWAGLILPGAPVWLFAVICFFLFLASNLIFFRVRGSSWLAVFFAASAPLWLMSWYKFENDLFAMPFILLAIYFFLKENDLAAFICLVPAGLLFQGSIVLAIAFSVSNPVFVLAWLPPALVFWKSFLALGPLSGVAESQPVVHFIYLGVLGWAFIEVLARVIKTKRWPHDRLESALLIACFFGLMNGRWFVFAVPFLGVWFAEYFKGISSRWKGIAAYISVVLFVGMLFALYSGPPSPEDLSLIREAGSVSWAENRRLMNSWSVGYWVEHELPGKATAWGGGEAWDTNYSGSFVLNAVWEPELSGCRVVEEARNVRLWEC